MRGESEKIGFKELIKILKKRYKIFISVTFICVLAAFIMVFFVIKPSYEAKTSVIIGTSVEINNPNLQDLALYQKLVKTYCSIVKTSIVAEKTIRELNLDMSSEELLNNLSANPQDDTQILEITVRANSPEEAVNIINTLTQVFIEESRGIIPAANLRAIDSAKLPDKPVSPNRKVLVVAALIAGIVLSGMIALLKEYFDNTIASEEDVKDYLGLRVIATIPKEPRISEKLDINSLENLNAIMEAFRNLRTNIEVLSSEGHSKTIMITSGCNGEGKTTTACILAVVMALAEKKTLLVDCNLRKPEINRIFKLEGKKGLSNILSLDMDCPDVILKTRFKNLYVLGAGESLTNPAELLISSNMKNLLSIFESEYDYIILDAPTAGVLTDAQILCQYADSCIFITSVGQASREESLQAKNALESANARILGVSLNNVAQNKKKFYESY